MLNKVQILQKLAIVVRGKVMLLRRSPENRHRPNTWDFPGGNVDDEDVKSQNEDILHAALKREIREETRLGLGNHKFEIVYIDSGLNSEGNLVIWLGYKCKLKTQPKVKLGFEHSEFKWVTKEQFLKLDFGYAEGSMKGQINNVSF